MGRAERWEFILGGAQGAWRGGTEGCGEWGWCGVGPGDPSGLNDKQEMEMRDFTLVKIS